LESFLLRQRIQGAVALKIWQFKVTNDMKNTMRLTGALGAVFTLFISVPRVAAVNIDQMIVFGDSLSDAGNLSIAAGPGVFTARDYDPLRATDGPTTTPATAISGLAVEQLNQLLGLPPLKASLLAGNDYAWGSATTGFTGLDLLTGATPGTGAQVAAYLAAHPVADPSSLYVLWAGSNDLLNATTTAGIQAAESTAISNLDLEITALLSAGAKNIVWFDLPDLSILPASLLEGPALDAQLHTSSALFQSDWLTSIGQLDALFPTAKITGVDVYSLLNNIFAKPASFGLTNVTTPAQGQVGVNPDQYLFWDGEHPTTKADSIVAGFALQQIQPVPEPSSYGAFGAAVLLGAILVRRRKRGAK
jgi:phospholipase/lecithinase/hemolysin